MKTLVKDALYNLSISAGAETAYARGILVGVVSTIMAERRLNYFEAVEVIKPHLPDDFDPDAIPNDWKVDFS